VTAGVVITSYPPTTIAPEHYTIGYIAGAMATVLIIVIVIVIFIVTRWGTS